jgi:multicomponent Na+:H+ antiporter subunit B
MPLLLLFAMFLLLRGHNEPGGGFVGGLVVAAAFVLYAAAHGVPASRRGLFVDAPTLISVGLMIALGSGIPAVLKGSPFMTAVWMTIGVEGNATAVGTPLIFDIGVFLTVIGVVLTIVFTLAEDVLVED